MAHGGSQTLPSIFFEYTIIEAVANRLTADGWEIVSTCKECEHGDDLVATRNGDILRIEAKGQGSSKPTSRKFGKPFNKSESRMNVVEALYRAASMAESHNCQAGMVFPDTALYREHFGRIRNAVSKLKLKVFWVSADGTVVLEPDSTHP